MQSSNKTKEFISKARAKHGDKYSYDKSIYTKSTVKVIITCSKHGDFMQTPNSHLSGKGCMECSGKKARDKFSFERDSRKVHGGKYDYSKVEYKGIKNKVKIICPKHGEFMQRPDIHLSGHGCYECGRDSFSESMTISTDDFIKDAIATHGDKYDYSDLVYTSSKGKVKIICRRHGEFYQTAYVHKNGGECPMCSKSGFDSSMDSFVYIAVTEKYNHMKVGITNDIEKRKVTLQSQTPFDVSFSKVFKTQNARGIETHIKRIGKSANFEGFHGHTEWIEYDDNIIKLVEFMSGL